MCIFVGSLTAELDTSTTYQEILGFGGAFTDSTGINLNSLRKETQNLLMRQYFGPTGSFGLNCISAIWRHVVYLDNTVYAGSEYTFGRVPIASTDFSLREYSYDEIDGDFDLTHFALQNDDFQYKAGLYYSRIRYEFNNNISILLRFIVWYCCRFRTSSKRSIFKSIMEACVFLLPPGQPLLGWR